MTDGAENASPPAAPPSSEGAGSPPSARVSLLAVDLGLRLGLAGYDAHGALVYYRSTHLGSPSQLRRAVPGILAEHPALTHLVAEGDRALFEIWARAAARRAVSTQLVAAEAWREALFPARQRRTGSQAKQAADRLARQIIAASPAKNPTSLRHDAAEAILLGLWAVRQLGWAAT